MHPRPILDPGDQVLLDGVREDVGEALHLRGHFVRDQDALVAARPDLVLPAGQAGDLPRQIASEDSEVFTPLTRAPR